MTTTQPSTNGHCVSPLPCSVEIADMNGADLPADKADDRKFANGGRASERETPPFAGNACHVPLQPYAPKANLHEYGDFASGQTNASPLPERCQFLFSDGRQCTMARSDIHPSLCRYHSEREDQLFGEPGSHIVGRALDLPEL